MREHCSWNASLSIENPSKMASGENGAALGPSHTVGAITPSRDASRGHEALLWILLGPVQSGRHWNVPEGVARCMYFLLCP